MTDLKLRLAAWHLGRKVQPEASQWAQQVLDAASDLGLILVDPYDEEMRLRLADALAKNDGVPLIRSDKVGRALCEAIR